MELCYYNTLLTLHNISGKVVYCYVLLAFRGNEWKKIIKHGYVIALSYFECWQKKKVANAVAKRL